ncbi:hypothetical protein ACO2Q7_09405 [Rathayibacter sp. KR2-224]|uniref:hypothetical protein n=1 Tax=Rathayibacter sp. KR2-224 TaxID=3400913 RepID=UPI003C0F0DEB
MRRARSAVLTAFTAVLMSACLAGCSAPAHAAVPPAPTLAAASHRTPLSAGTTNLGSVNSGWFS